jgi:hypothetical protein
VSTQPVSLPNPLAPLQSAADLAKVIAAAFTTVLNPKMWRSFGWLMLGLVLIGLGLMFWLKAPIESAVGTVGGAFAKAP